MVEFDTENIKKLKQQDQNAFNQFYLQTVDMFFRYINANYFLAKQDAEDIISDFYVKFWEGVKSYKENQSFNAYFRTIFKNTLKDFFKKNSDTPFTDLHTDDEGMAFEDTLVDDVDLTKLLENDFKFEQIEKAMKNLDDISKDIIYFKFIEEKTNEEISLITGTSHEMIRQRLSRAIKQLKKLLDSTND
ncbi:MAG: sigma-70 family RNA polymerase sigma factor [candidate division SR1 bacterium]|nr:sigma-70 family RNA polymerase sigma factor [candidate division SR1 bacterium]